MQEIPLLLWESRVSEADWRFSSKAKTAYMPFLAVDIKSTVW